MLTSTFYKNCLSAARRTWAVTTVRIVPTQTVRLGWRTVTANNFNHRNVRAAGPDRVSVPGPLIGPLAHRRIVAGSPGRPGPREPRVAGLSRFVQSGETASRNRGTDDTPILLPARDGTAGNNAGHTKFTRKTREALPIKLPSRFKMPMYSQNRFPSRSSCAGRFALSMDLRLPSRLRKVLLPATHSIKSNVMGNG